MSVVIMFWTTEVKIASFAMDSTRDGSRDYQWVPVDRKTLREVQRTCPR